MATTPTPDASHDSYAVQDGVAVITLSNPPVNSLALALRTRIQAGLERAAADAAVTAVVLIGEGKSFSGGAEIREFNTPRSSAWPNLRDVIATLDRMEKPVVAAVSGVALGGGLELAMSCHYRVAHPKALLALPEVKLGLLPGAAGTQRLPRLIGLEAALNMVVSGNTVPAAQFKGTPLVDELVEGDLLAGALAFARKLVADKAPLRRTRDLKVDYPNHQAFLQFARNTVATVAKHYPAPPKCIDAVEASVTMAFDDGQRFERACFEQLVLTNESKALRHAFFAERAAQRIEGVPEGTPARAIASAAIIGAGTMGGGIAINFANAGIPVALLETKQDALDRGLANVRKVWEAAAKRGRMKPEDVDKRMALLRPTLSYDAIRDADIVIEAVFEDIAVKEAVFRQLDGVMKPGAILASNTSTLDLDRIASFTKRPQDVVGTHFFSPANVMKLLEVVRGKATAPDVLATTMALAKKLKKTAVVSGVCDGFIGNRMVEQYVRQAGFLLEEGCLPGQVDRAIEAFGFAMGPLRMSDLAGNDIGWYIRKRRYVEQPDFVYSCIPDLICELGRYGQKTGAGFYDYAPGDRKARPSKLVDELIVKHSADIGLARRKVSDEEIVERLVYSLVNEGARILEEGIAARASDIDLVYLTGYGFPVWRGGPMFHADTVGLPRVLVAMQRYAKGRHGEAWTPAPLLAKLAAEDGRFNEVKTA